MNFQRIAEMDQVGQLDAYPKSQSQSRPPNQTEESDAVVPTEPNEPVLSPGDFQRVRLLHNPFELGSQVDHALVFELE